MFWSTLLHLLAAVGVFFLFMAVIVIVALVIAPSDHELDDEEQAKFLKEYFNRKDDNND